MFSNPFSAKTKASLNGRRTIREAFQEFILAKQGENLSPRSITFYKYTIGGFLDFLESESIKYPGEIKASHVSAYLVAVRARGVKDATIHAHARSARVFINWLAESGIVAAPFKIKMPKVSEQARPVPSVEDFLKLLSACRTPRDRALLMIMADTGLRGFEVAGLTWGDLDMEARTITVRRAKGGKRRINPISLETAEALMCYRKYWPHEDDLPIFQTYPGQGLTRHGIFALFARLSKRAGVSISAHQIRRFFATQFLRNGGDLYTLQRLMGHSTIEMTARYVGFLEADLIKAHERAAPLSSILGSEK